MTITMAPAPILTACFVCGWVHGFPWRCPLAERLHGGANNVLVPRGVFFDPKLYASLNGSWDPNSPLAEANINGNDNTGTAHLNSRVIQLVITKNLTLAHAWGILDLARANATGAVAAFPLLATSEFYTLGLAQEVDDLAPNTFVASSGNASAPPPSPEWWEKAWNSLVGFGQWVWNGAVAVATFFYNVGVWLVDIAVGVIIGLATGNWTYFQENVIEPLQKALEALVKFIMDFILAAINWLFSPLIQAYKNMQQAALSAAMVAVDPPALSDVLNAIITAVILSVFSVFLISAIVAIRVILKATESFGFGWIVGLVIGAIVGVFVGVKIAEIVYGNRVQELIPAGFDNYVDWAFTASDFVIALGLLLAAWVRGWKTFGKAAVGLWAAVISFAILGIAATMAARGDRLGFEVAFFMDIVASVAAVAGLGYPTEILYDYSLLNPIASALGYAALITSLASLAADGVSFMRLSGP